MLRMLEINRPRIVESNNPLEIVYTLLPSEHMICAAGRAPWDPHGLHYEVIDGALRYLASFEPPSQLIRILLHSRVHFWTRKYGTSLQTITDKDYWL
jgi:hypothetical protein